MPESNPARESPVRWPVGQILYRYAEEPRCPRVGDTLALDNGQRVEVVTAKCSDGGIEPRKQTVRVLA